MTSEGKYMGKLNLSASNTFLTSVNSSSPLKYGKTSTTSFTPIFLSRSLNSACSDRLLNSQFTLIVDGVQLQSESEDHESEITLGKFTSNSNVSGFWK